MIRVGLGYDAHRLVSRRPLVLGGVVIEHHAGLEGHSDADVISHAIADAVLGGAGLGELGEMFPASDDRWKNASSMMLLREVGDRLRAVGGRIVNIDSVIVADQPRLRSFRESMRVNVAEALGASVDTISIKPKSNEGLGFEGRGEGMSAHAVALVEVAE